MEAVEFLSATGAVVSRILLGEQVAEGETEPRPGWRTFVEAVGCQAGNHVAVFKLNMAGDHGHIEKTAHQLEFYSSSGKLLWSRHVEIGAPLDSPPDWAAMSADDRTLWYAGLEPGLIILDDMGAQVAAFQMNGSRWRMFYELGVSPNGRYAWVRADDGASSGSSFLFFDAKTKGRYRCASEGESQIDDDGLGRVLYKWFDETLQTWQSKVVCSYRFP